MEMITLKNGKTVYKKDYVRLKTKDLINFGYTSLKESEVAEQVDKILKNEQELTVIGMFIIDDFDLKK